MKRTLRSHKSDDGYYLLVSRLQEKHEELTEYRQDVRWKFFQGEAPEASKQNFDDSTWETVSLPKTIDTRIGEAWLRTRITIPNQIAGIEVSGSVAKMFSSVILDKIEIYLDSKKIFSADYWADLGEYKILLDEKATPVQSHVVAIHFHPKYEPVGVPSFSISYSLVEKTAFEIDSFVQELRFAKFLDERLTEKACQGFRQEAFNGKHLALLEEINKARAKLTSLAQKAKEFNVHLVAHAHIDMNWLWPWEDTLNTIKETFSTMVKLMDKYPDFCFSQSQAVTYRVIEQEYPELFEAIRKHVKRGNWDITASMWTEADLNMVGTEALVRQFLEAKRYVKEKFGFEPEICWEPDTFGHIWTLPQIASKAGLKYYYFMRCGKGHPIFKWQSPDGTRVLAFTSVYNNSVTPKNIVDVAIDLYSRYGLKTSMFVYGVGDHGGGATIEDVEAAHEIQKKKVLPAIAFSSTHRFFEEVEKQPSIKTLPVINDELQFTFDGCYTTHGDIKRYNRLCERLLLDAERFAVLSGKYPRNYLRKAWLNMLFNQFHDILDGSGAPEGYVLPVKLAKEALKIADDVLKSSVRTLAERIKLSENGIPIVVFNSLSWDRTDLVKIKVPKRVIPRNPIVISAGDQEKSAVQVGGDEVLFLAKVPSMGYRVYYLVEGIRPEEDLAGLSASENSVENEFFRLEIERTSGTITSLYDKVSGMFVFKKDRFKSTVPVFSNLLQVLYELPHDMSAWIIGEISRTENLIRGAEVELAESGPVRASLKVVHKHSKSEITQRISVLKGIPRVDFETVIDWGEVSDDKTEAPMLKVSFTPILGDSKATFEIPFGYVERVADGTETPALRWVDLSDGEYGVSLLNDSKHGFDVKGNTVRMTLVRTSYSPDPKPDQRVHEIRYSVFPHKGGWKEALTFRKGYELNHPLEAIMVKRSPRSNGSEPETASFIQVKPNNVVVSCVKLAEESDDYIIRIYDASGEGAEAEILFGFQVKEAYEADLMEKKQANLETHENKLNLSLRPFDVRTVRIKRS
jgi:alpha-mannosidase